MTSILYQLNPKPADQSFLEDMHTLEDDSKTPMLHAKKSEIQEKYKLETTELHDKTTSIINKWMEGKKTASPQESSDLQQMISEKKEVAKSGEYAHIDSLRTESFMYAAFLPYMLLTVLVLIFANPIGGIIVGALTLPFIVCVIGGVLYFEEDLLNLTESHRERTIVTDRLYHKFVAEYLESQAFKPNKDLIMDRQLHNIYLDWRRSKESLDTHFLRDCENLMQKC